MCMCVHVRLITRNCMYIGVMRECVCVCGGCTVQACFSLYALLICGMFRNTHSHAQKTHTVLYVLIRSIWCFQTCFELCDSGCAQNSWLLCSGFSPTSSWLWPVSHFISALLQGQTSAASPAAERKFKDGKRFISPPFRPVGDCLDCCCDPAVNNRVTLLSMTQVFHCCCHCWSKTTA